MALRIQLISDILGSFVIDHDDPVGINEITQTVKRSADNDGVVFVIVLDLGFIKQGRRFIKQAFEQCGGIDAVVKVNVYLYDPNARRFNLYNQGTINFAKYALEEDKVTVNIDQGGFQNAVLNLLEQDVDLETTKSIDGTTLPATQVLDLPYHSKKIVKQTNSHPNDSNEYQFLDVFEMTIPNDIGGGHVGRDGVCIGSIDTSGVTNNELTESFQVQFGVANANGNFNTGDPRTISDYITLLSGNKDNRSEIYRATEAGKLNGNIHVNLRQKVTVDNLDGDVDICGEGALGYVELNYWFEIRDKNNNILLLECMHEFPVQACGTEDLGYQSFNYVIPTDTDIQIGYKVYVYYTIRVFGNYEQPTGLVDGHLHHNFIVQNAPDQWVATTSYALGDPVIHGGHKWSSNIDNNQGITPGVDGNWIDEGEWAYDPNGTHINFSSATVAPPTIARTILLHDAIKKACQYVTNQIDCFYSDLLGRTDLGYVVDGDGALIGWTNGGSLRRLAGKKIFGNLKEMIAFTNSLFCTSFGFQFLDGRWVLRLERKSFFFNKNISTASLGKVAKVKATLDPKRFYNLVQYGYEGKLEIGQVNAIDEFNSLRKAGIPIRNTTNTLKISTTVRCSGYQIEAQRRLQFSTADSKLDDDKFGVVVIRDTSVPGGYRTKQDEGYAEILNVFDPPSGYNYDISPARILRNWYQYLAGMLVRAIVPKVLNFTYGEINYTMKTRKVGEAQLLDEQGNFDISNIEALFEPMVYTFGDNPPFNAAQFTNLVQQPYGVVDFEDMFGATFEGFVDDNGIDHDSTKGTGDFSLLKVYRK